MPADLYALSDQIPGTTSSLFRWDGSISISSLKKQQLINSKIEDGYITFFHPNNTRTELKEADVMPEVVVVAYVHYDTGTDFSTWLWLNYLFYNTDMGGGGSYGDPGYGSINTGGSGSGYSGGGGSNTGTGGTGGGIPEEDISELEAEYIYNVHDIDVWKYFNCFDNIPSAGATYTIKLCADIPSNYNPQASSVNSAISAGHTFLTITKSNGDQKVTQSFGFYPLERPSVFDPFGSVSSTIKDNGGNEYNAAIEMTISDGQFNTIKNDAISWSTFSYNLGNYNCTNYAMDIFNSVRTNPIAISPYQIVLPGDPAPYAPSNPNTITIDKSPQMLFIKLQQMKNSNDPEAASITIDQTHNSLSPASKGECN